MSYRTENIRNVALAGHSGAGKTTLFEALLHAGGAIPAAGSLERGTTVSDFDPMEKARGHSLNTALASLDHGGIHVNLIDTPGYADFRGHTLSAFSAVETVAIVVNAATGIEYGTRRMMDYAKARNLCRLLVINRIDADPGHLAHQVRPRQRARDVAAFRAGPAGWCARNSSSGSATRPNRVTGSRSSSTMISPATASAANARTARPASTWMAPR